MRWYTSLIVLSFLWMGCGSSDNVEEVQALRTRVDTLETQLSQARARVETLRESRSGRTVEVLPVDIFFNRGSADLSRRGSARLDSIADLLSTQYPDRQVRVEGYADDLPLSDSLEQIYNGNWELSSARAAAVVRYFQWAHEMDPARFEVVGLGSYRPIVPNDNPENRRRNRRVRVAVLPEDVGS